jgi:hypothetical protein
MLGLQLQHVQQPEKTSKAIAPHVQSGVCVLVVSFGEV